MRLFTVILSLLVSQSLFAAWTGSYLSTSQQGLAVEITAENQYLLYAIQDNQLLSIEVGIIDTSDQYYLYFNPVESINGLAQASTATITQNACAFTWGEAGEFRLDAVECQPTEPNSSEQNIVSTFNGSTALMEIPQVGVPNAQGSFDIYKLTLQLIGLSPIRLQLVDIGEVTNPVNMLSAAFQQQFLYIPVLAVDYPAEPVFPVYELLFQVESLEPFIVTEYQPIQYSYPGYNVGTIYSDPTLNPYGNLAGGAMSNISSLLHSTSMNIIGNI